MTVSSLALGVSADPITSVYTSLSKCRLVKVQGDSSNQACAGIGGYNLQLLYGDARETITVIDAQGKKHPLDLWFVVNSGFSSVGQKAEWRVTRRNGKILPIALIVRFGASENAADSSKVTSYLVVAKITRKEICVTDKIRPGPTANIEARKAADESENKPCLASP
jgi:hypothetical protein